MGKRVADIEDADYQDIYATLTGLARRAVRLRDPEEVVSESLASVWEAIRSGRYDDYDCDRLTGRIFYTAAKNELRRYYRSRCVASMEECGDIEDAPSLRPEMLAVQKESLFEIMRAATELTAEDQALFAQRVVDRQPCKQIAQSLGLSVGAVRVRVHRMKGKLRRALAG